MAEEAVGNEAWQNLLDHEHEDDDEEEREAANEEEDTQDGRGRRGGEGGGGVTRLDEEEEDKMFRVDDLREEELAKLTGKEWWQCHLGTVRQRMATLHQHGRLFDVVLIFPRHNVQMKAHKLVLGMSSPVLEAMLFGPLGKDTDGSPQRLTLEEDLPETFEWILRYLYRDDTRFQGTLPAIGVYEAAHKYQMDALVKVCSKYLADAVDPDNFPHVYDAALLHDDPDLLHRCYEVTAVRGREVLNSPDLCLLRRAAFRTLLASPRLHVDKESFVFRAVVQWGWYHLDEGPPPPAKPSPALLPARQRLRAVIDEFLPHVRFLAMDINEFVSEVEGSNLLSPAECMAVVRTLRNLTPAAVLPRFVSADATRRRETLVNVVQLVSSPQNQPLVLEHHDRISLNLVQNFTVGAVVHLVRLNSTGVCTLKEGNLQVWDEDGDHLARGVWTGNGCFFRRPVTLAVGRRYSAVLTVQDAWCAVTSTAISMAHRRIVFKGQTQCGGRLRMDYIPGSALPPPAGQRRQPLSVCVVNAS